MTATSSRRAQRMIHLAPGAGRSYPMGPLRAIFKADGDETRGRYSISEWWVAPRTRGPGAHTHDADEDDVFYVLEGTMSIQIGDEWIDAPAGSFVLAPGGVPHNFENRGAKRAGMLNIQVAGDFEQHMPGIAEWFSARSAADAAIPAPRASRPARRKAPTRRTAPRNTVKARPRARRPR